MVISMATLTPKNSDAVTNTVYCSCDISSTTYITVSTEGLPVYFYLLYDVCKFHLQFKQCTQNVEIGGFDLDSSANENSAT